ncbi:glucosamine 6-phosphate N-acetyltransferase isoform X3 [Phascolarctos cinereus]
MKFSQMREKVESFPEGDESKPEARGLTQPQAGRENTALSGCGIAGGSHLHPSRGLFLSLLSPSPPPRPLRSGSSARAPSGLGPCVRGRGRHGCHVWTATAPRGARERREEGKPERERKPDADLTPHHQVKKLRPRKVACPRSQTQEDKS